MEKRNNFEDEIYKYFSENKELPQEIKDSIFNIDLKTNEKKLNFHNIKNIIVTAISLAMISTGIVFAKDISQFAKSIFWDSKKGTETAIENGYIYDSNEKNNIELEADKTNIQISRMIMDDYTLDIEMLLEIEDDIDITTEHVNFPDMLITDDMNNILYCMDNNKINKLKYILYFIISVGPKIVNDGKDEKRGPSPPLFVKNRVEFPVFFLLTCMI